LIAELPGKLRIWRVNITLQWGRDQLIAELQAVLQRPKIDIGFNGAAIN